VAFLEGLVVGDISGLADGTGSLSVFTNEKGGIIDDTVITKVSRPSVTRAGRLAGGAWGRKNLALSDSPAMGRRPGSECSRLCRASQAGDERAAARARPCSLDRGRACTCSGME
jgi:hypothetical protein